MIKVLIVDDSKVTIELLKYILRDEPDIQVIGTANNGFEAIEFIINNKPDVITMDVNMPKMGGIEAIRNIMSTTPVPIIIVSSSLNPYDVKDLYTAMEAGAVSVIEKPCSVGVPQHEVMAKNFIESIRLMSEIKVVKRWNKKIDIETNPNIDKISKKINPDIKIVVIGVSTGGPPVLQAILSSLPKNFPFPILVVQHISEGFLLGLVEWLNEKSGLNIKIAENAEIVESGNVYFAPNNFQMKVSKIGRIILTDDAPENNIKPSVSYLFRSIAQEYKKNAIGILLTGMGRDGAIELLEMREAGAVTIAQNKESSTIFGMPGEAVKLNAAKYILSPDKILEMLMQYVEE